MKFINDFHESRLSLISSKLSELEAKLSQQQAQLDSYLQISQHMRILAPIQQRTRENLIFSAGSLSAKIDWLWLERKRNLAYWDILSREQEVERLICANTMALDNNSIVSASTRRLSIQSDLASILTSVPPKIAFEQASVLSSTLMRHGSGTSNVANATETNSSGFKAEEASGIHDKSNEDIRHYNENYGEYDDDDYDDDDADYTMARMDQNDSDNFEDEKDFLGDILPGTTENGESAISLSRNRFSVISTQESIYYDPETGDAPIYGSGERINIIDQAVQHPKFSSKKPMLASVSHSGSTTSLPSLPMKESRKDMKLHPRLSAQNSSSSLSTSFHKLTKEYQTTDPFAGFPSTLNITRDDIEPSSRDDDYNNSLIDTISDSRKSSEDNGFITDLSDRTDSLETELSGTDELNEISDVKRNPSLIRQDSADFTVKGKKFSLVEVNPNFGSLQNHKRTMSQNLNNPVYQKSNISKGSDSSIPLMR
ncbi:hypothetical protein NADFUDRAFT_47984 [Nadsonia fulvescens var. elongata DSM 6958]|uniref:Uncharacterized protein n=1 Tax=Nadsonia fulvescens var. elongata DSM 6958 TaxID=857566 RepID=A0A1E3PDW1_9ASCO|nr:hypothetical protein NADFUDRAFT_47984 [Nadsonia fulvescens var. elongata DSM 6958]